MFKFVALCALSSAAAFQAPTVARPAVAPAAASTEVARVADVTMGATIRELRDRVSSVKNTKKITSAMKLVAAAKVRRAQEAVLRSRPFSETLERILGGLLQRLKTESLDIPLMEARTAKKVGLVAITGDRGLCGSYNAAAIKKTEQRIAELKAQVCAAAAGTEPSHTLELHSEAAAGRFSHSHSLPRCQNPFATKMLTFRTPPYSLDFAGR